MNKVGLVTIYAKNYGSVLQCYASKQYLMKQGFDCDALYHDISGAEKLTYWFNKAIKVLFYSIKYNGFFRFFIEDTKAQHTSIDSLTKESVQYLDDFTQNILQPKGYTVSQLKSIQNEYSFFLAGADQVWNGARIIDPFMFLCFCDDKRKVSIAPSFGVNKISKFNEKEFKKRLEGFAFLSAREISGQKIISSLTKKECERVADPVLLLKRDEWSEFGLRSKVSIEHQYVLVHFLDKPSDSTLRIINNIAKKKSLSIVCLSYPHDEYNQLDSFTFINGTPYDYIQLIENADFVCTDSFHTTQFSIIFNKNFLVFERNYTHKNSQQSRLDTLISIYSCADRFVQKGTEEIDYTKVDIAGDYKKITESEHDSLTLYLAKSLNM